MVPAPASNQVLIAPIHTMVERQFLSLRDRIQHIAGLTIFWGPGGRSERPELTDFPRQKVACHFTESINQDQTAA